MNDLNFFEPYLFEEQKAEEKKPLRNLLRAIAIVLIVALPSGLWGAIALEKSQIDQMKAELSQPSMQEAMNKIQQKEADLRELQSVQPILQQADQALKDFNGVTDQHVQAIADAVPQNLVLGKSIISQAGCEITGTALNKAAIAELEYNLRQTGLFDGLLLQSLKLNGSNYEFKLSFVLKGGVPR